MIEFMVPIIQTLLKDVSPGRLAEGLVLTFVVWRQVKPHLTKIEERMEGLEKAVKHGFQSGEQRFENIEIRITALEQQKEVTP